MKKLIIFVLVGLISSQFNASAHHICLTVKDMVYGHCLFNGNDHKFCHNKSWDAQFDCFLLCQGDGMADIEEGTCTPISEDAIF